MNKTAKRKILENLNDEQKIPVINYKGPQFVVAGPGSGKTYTIVQRTKYMIEDGVNPYHILIFTFTNKAANEIKERISAGVGEDNASKITMGTYHSFCCRLLRKHCEVLGYKKGFSIFDTDDSDKILKKITKHSNVDFKMLGAYISGAKRHLLTPTQAIQKQQYGGQDSLGNMYQMYQNELKNQNAMDFDDLIFNTVKMLEQNPDILEAVNNRFRYISADESHDSSGADIRLIQLLAGEDQQNICFILDDNQSIYGFRGADIDAVLNIKNIFPNLKEYFLNRNYRCSGNIVGASKSLIKNNKKQIKKDIYTTNPDGNKIIVFEEKDSNKEALRVAKTIKLLNTKYEVSYKDIAILYRTSSQSRIIEEVLLKYKIPYEILSGVNFFQRKEIKDIIAYLRLLINPYDKQAFDRIINSPKRGIGKTSIEKIEDIMNSVYPPIDPIDACREALESKALKGTAKKGVESFLEIIDKLLDKLDISSVPEMITEVLSSTEYYKYLESEEKEEEDYDSRVDNIAELIELAYEFDSLEEFIEQTSLNRKDEEDHENGKVQLLTMHMSKGLEWKTVFLIGSNEGTCPHFRSLDSLKQIEEERRLYYVGMTRAKENLFITRAEKVKQGGFFRNTTRSRFIDEIDEEYLYINGK